MHDLLVFFLAVRVKGLSYRVRIGAFDLVLDMVHSPPDLLKSHVLLVLESRIVKLVTVHEGVVVLVADVACSFASCVSTITSGPSIGIGLPDLRPEPVLEATVAASRLSWIVVASWSRSIIAVWSTLLVLVGLLLLLLLLLLWLSLLDLFLVLVHFLGKR